MWGNIAKLSAVVGNAVDKVKKFQNELESQLDAAVGADDGAPSTSTTVAGMGISSSFFLSFPAFLSITHKFFFLCPLLQRVVIKLTKLPS